MNLLALTAGQIGAVNQNVPVAVRVSTGVASVDASGEPVPSYATPGAFTARFEGSVMTVTSQTAGRLQIGQRVTGAGLTPTATIVRQITGEPGGLGNYLLDAPQATLGQEQDGSALLDDSQANTFAPNNPTYLGVSCAANFVLLGQVQPMGWKDLQQMEGLNVQGTLRKIYLYGQVEAIVRSSRKGGDLITDPAGDVWLTTNVLEDFVYAGWCCVAVTLQNGE